jgi:transposase InsO family protein
MVGSCAGPTNSPLRVVVLSCAISCNPRRLLSTSLATSHFGCWQRAGAATSLAYIRMGYLDDMSPPSVARLPPFREVRSFAPPPRGGFALSLVAAGHNSMHSGVCLHTRRLRWCKLLYNTLLSLRAKVLSPPPFDSLAISSQLDSRLIGFAPRLMAGLPLSRRRSASACEESY